MMKQHVSNRSQTEERQTADHLVPWSSAVMSVVIFSVVIFVPVPFRPQLYATHAYPVVLI